MEHSEGKHIVTRFDKDLDEIETLLVEMADLVSAQIRNAQRAVKNSDESLAEEVSKLDRRINELEVQIDDQSIRVIALRQPMASDLRRSITTLKVSANLERMGDYAKTTARRVPELDTSKKIKPTIKTLTAMSKEVASMLDGVMTAYVNRDIELAAEAFSRDEDVDDMYSTVLRELLTYMMEDPRKIETCTHLLFIAKNLERAGDQVTNIAEQVNFLVTGNTIED